VGAWRSCWCHWARGVGACGAACEGHQRDVAGALDGYAEPTLVARADAGHAARENLAALLHELGEDVGALVVDEVHFFDAKLADFFLAKILALAARASAGTSTWATGAAFAAWTAMTAARAVSATVTAGATFATRSAAGGLRLLLLLICHNCLPFPFDSDSAEVSKSSNKGARDGPRPPQKANWRPLALGLRLELPGLAPEPVQCGADGVRHGLRAFARASSGA